MSKNVSQTTYLAVRWHPRKSCRQLHQDSKSNFKLEYHTLEFCGLCEIAHTFTD